MPGDRDMKLSAQVYGANAFQAATRLILAIGKFGVIVRCVDGADISDVSVLCQRRMARSVAAAKNPRLGVHH